MMTFTQLFLFFTWGITNTLFLVKYSPFPETTSVVLGGVLTIIVYFLQKKLSIKSNIDTKLVTFLWWTTILSTLILQVVILFLIDKENVTVDRWSALEYFWQSFFRGEYPYAVQTHVNNGNTPSPLPVWQCIALPFCILGDVGLLQIAFFLVVTTILTRAKIFIKEKLRYLVFIVLSPLYWYEIVTRSDMISSMIFGVLAIYLIFYNSSLYRSKNRYLIIILILALSMSTRTVLAIPFAIIISALSFPSFKSFFGISISSGFLFLLLLVPFLLWDIDLFFQYNPLTLHSNKVMPEIIIISLFISLLIGIKLRSISLILFWAGVLITVIGYITFFNAIFAHGFEQTIVNDEFDLIYLGMGLPFIIAGTLAKDKETLI